MDRTLFLDTVIIANLPQEEQNKLREGYIRSFPPDERRDWEQIASPQPDSLTTLVVRSEGDIGGLLSYWELDSYIYVEHFFLLEALRSHGLGGKALKQLSELYPERGLVLEAEPEGTSPMAGRRLRFYQRLGLDILPIDYIQPAYREDSIAVRLHLLCSLPLGEEESQHIADLLHRRVYGR